MKPYGMHPTGWGVLRRKDWKRWNKLDRLELFAWDKNRSWRRRARQSANREEGLR